MESDPGVMILFNPESEVVLTVCIVFIVTSNNNDKNGQNYSSWKFITCNCSYFNNHNNELPGGNLL